VIDNAKQMAERLGRAGDLGHRRARAKRTAQPPTSAVHYGDFPRRMERVLVAESRSLLVEELI
jgi:hypothetical protein